MPVTCVDTARTSRTSNTEVSGDTVVGGLFIASLTLTSFSDSTDCGNAAHTRTGPLAGKLRWCAVAPEEAGGAAARMEAAPGLRSRAPCDERHVMRPSHSAGKVQRRRRWERALSMCTVIVKSSEGLFTRGELSTNAAQERDEVTQDVFTRGDFVEFLASKTALSGHFVATFPPPRRRVGGGWVDKFLALALYFLRPRRQATAAPCTPMQPDGSPQRDSLVVRLATCAAATAAAVAARLTPRSKSPPALVSSGQRCCTIFHCSPRGSAQRRPLALPPHQVMFANADKKLTARCTTR